MNNFKNSLLPVIDSDSNILILGSLPSDKSIEKSEYYGNKTNQFWNIITLIFNNEKIKNRTVGDLRPENKKSVPRVAKDGF